ncbi:MAG: LamB/YcsF family protein [Actinomycetes bacterium]
MPTIDLNADLGESYGPWQMGDDPAMLDIVTSANIACGFHAGDPLIMHATVELAVEKGVRVGAHISYRDLEGFGRRAVEIAPDELRAHVLYQLGAIAGMCKAVGTTLAYVKPHGALYNTIVHHEEQARAVVHAIGSFDPSLPLMGLPGGLSLELAEQEGLRTIGEAFVDRGYTPQGTLVSRKEPGALIHDPEEAAERMLKLVTHGVIIAVDGTEVPMKAESICTHGDSPGAVAMARSVRASLEANGVTIRAFT